MILRLLPIIIVLLHQSAFAEESFFGSAARGWHWYESKKEEEEKKAKLQLTPLQKTKVFNQELEKKLHTAIWHPTEKNIIAYLKIQEELMDRSEKFAFNWQKVIYYHPELDSKVKHPTTQAALPIYYAEQQKEIENKIKSLAKNYGLIYIYRSECPYCQKFAPVVKDFAARYNWQVLGISLDGKQIEEFPNSKQNNGIAEALNIKVVPALLAVNPKDNSYIPVAYGYISQQEMETRINLLVGKVK